LSSRHRFAPVHLMFQIFQGRGIRFGQLKHSDYLDVNTYEGHPWIFRESGVGDILIGQPGQISVYFPKRSNVNIINRVIILITFPLMSLRDWAVRAVANFVEITPYALLNLPIPASQIKVVQNLLVHRLQYVSIFEPNPLVGKRLRATVRRYMSQSFLMNGTQLQLVGATSGRLAEDQEQFEE
uniref:VHL domain-containing protein n=1 Tax=Angiostrongylus cantonensis TaxID=6313 RepID=A0A0K0CV83_ANGCA